MNLDELTLLDITDTIEHIIEKYKVEKSKKEKKNLEEQYIIYVNEYHKRTGTKNIFHNSLKNIK